MEDRQKSWITGCGCGCVSFIGIFLFTYGFCLVGSYLLWEHADLHEPYLRGPAVVVWGALAGFFVAFIFALITLFLSQSIAYRRLVRSSSSGAPASNPDLPHTASPQPGCLMPAVWLVLSVVCCLGGLGIVAALGAESEDAGVRATWIVAAPIGFALSGMLAAGIIHLGIRRASTAVRVVVPIGFALLGGVILLAVVVAFFAVIWPEL